MGNICYCCRKVSDFIQSKAVPNRIEEDSPLLSRANSDLESLSSFKTSGDLLEYPVLDQDHLLFPDIVLSSNVGAALGTEDSLQTFDLRLATRRQAQGVNDGERRLVSQPSTNVIHRELKETGTSQLRSREDEWPLLSSLFLIPLDQPNAALHPSPICTHWQGTEETDLNYRSSISSCKPELAKFTPNPTQTEHDFGQRGDVWTEEHVTYKEHLDKITELAKNEKEFNKEEWKYSNSAAQTNLTVETEPPSGPCECPGHHEKQARAQNWHFIAHREQSEDPDVLERLDTEESVETFEMGILKRSHCNEQEAISVDLLCMERKSSQREQSETLTDHQIGEMDEDLICRKKAMDQMQWNLQDSDQTKLAVTQMEPRTGHTEHFTLFVVDKLFLAPPNFTGTSLDTLLDDHIVDTNAEDIKDQVEGNSKNQELPAIPDMDPSEDTGFTVKIQAPGTETTDFQVSPLAMVQEIRQVLMDREETCRHTCFSLQLNEVKLENFTHLRSIPGLKEGSLLKVVEEPYTMRDVRFHLRHIRELLKSLDLKDGYNGVEGRSPSFLSYFIEDGMEEDNRPKRKTDGLKYEGCSPPEHILPGCKEFLLVPLQPHVNSGKFTECLKVLTSSSWNPPPGNRKMHGDLMYLSVVTMEDKHFCVTASTRGFYVNQSTAYSFSPKPANPSLHSHALLDLLAQISPIFKKNFSALLKKRGSTHPFERIATPFQVFSWTAPTLNHALDCVRAEDASFFCLGYEEHLPGQARDWNEELQSTRELPRNNLTDRVMRDRAVFKANSDFVSIATQGAKGVIDGNVMPINPREEPQQQIFTWSNILFTFAFDAQDQYRDLGGEAAARAAPLLDLNGVKAYWRVDQEGLYLLGTAVVDYCGYRVTAQSIVPGILGDREHSVVYGSVGFGKTIVSDNRFLELLDKPSKKLRVQRHLMLDEDDSPVELCSSIEHKGIVGSDGRHYILNLLFTFPPDLNFLSVEEEDLNPVCQQLGFPKQHRHRLVCLRQELIEAFVEHRFQICIETVSQSAECNKEINKTLGLFPIKSNSTTCTQHATTAVTVSDLDTQQPVSIHNIQHSPSIKHVLSSLMNTFDIHFNPNVFISGVRFPKESMEDIQKQKQQLKDAAEFLLSNQIPAFIKSCFDHRAMPMDGKTLTEGLHQHGINVRYLGTVLEYIAKIPQKERLDHVYRIALCELITRCAKHLFKAYLLAVEPSALSSSISHFLNCFLSSFADARVIQQNDRWASRRRFRWRQSHASVGGTFTAWSNLTPSDLWKNIGADSQEYFNYIMPCGSVKDAVEECSIQRITLLREFAIKTGIQILLREYDFENNKNRAVFTEEDILNIFPVVKHITPKASDALHLLHCGQSEIQQGCLKEGCELISQALGLFTNVYGALHQEVCVCLRLLGRIHYILGEYAESISHQQRAVLISERVHGIEHPNTILEYKSLGLYSFAVGQPAIALRLLYRSRYLMLVVCGEDHPEMALLDSTIGLILHSMMACDLALKFLENAFALTSKYKGPTSLKLALSHHFLAKVHESKGDFRAALRHEKERYGIYKEQVGETHEKTLESSEYLKHLTHQAVILQKTMNWLYRTGSDPNIAPINLNAPNRVWIVEQLNLVTGIVLIPLSNKELEKLRTDTQLPKLQQNDAQSVEDLQ